MKCIINNQVELCASSSAKKGSGVLGREVDLLAKGCVGLVEVGLVDVAP